MNTSEFSTLKQFRTFSLFSNAFVDYLANLYVEEPTAETTGRIDLSALFKSKLLGNLFTFISLPKMVSW